MHTSVNSDNAKFLEELLVVAGGYSSREGESPSLPRPSSATQKTTRGWRWTKQPRERFPTVVAGLQSYVEVSKQDIFTEDHSEQIGPIFPQVST